jgi:TP901 family phage tail tape measure protein
MQDAAVAGESFGSKMGGWGKSFSKLGKATAAVGVAFAVTSVKMAADFQTQMTRLYTAAGLTQAQLKSLGLTSDTLNAQVLKIGTSVGFTGTEMATALYHPISAGLDLKTALQVVTYAAEEAKISGASLEDTTYSLSSVMKSFNEPASQAKQVMADLNSVVGQGDMHFQEFNQSIKNWAPTAAQMGISITSMGAGLDYLTDRGNSAEVASTRLTMGISMMTTPSAQAAKLLTSLGVASMDVHASSAAMTEALKKAHITQNQLAQDLKKPDGLYVALNDLKTSLVNAGVSGTEADSVLAKIFGGGRSDKAVMALMQNLGGLKDKYQEVQQHANGKEFDQAWAQTQATFSQQMAQMKAGVENLAISVGLKLIPIIQKVVGWFQQHQTATKALAGLIGTVLAGSVIKFVSGALSPLVSTVSNLGKGFGAAKQGLSLLSQGFNDAKVAGSAFSGPMGTIGGQLRNLTDGVSNLASAGWDKLKGAGSTISDLASSGWSKVVSGVQALGGAMKTAALSALEFSRNTLTAMISAGRAAVAFVAEKVALVATAVAEKAAAAAEWLLNIALDANPIMLIVLAIAALVAALVYAYNHFTWFRDGVNAVFHAVGAAVSWVVDFVKSHWQLLLAIITGPIGMAVYLITHYWAQIKAGFAAAWSFIVTSGETAARWLQALPGRILGWFSGAYNWLLTAGHDIVMGLWHGIESMGSWIANQITGFIQAVVPGPVLKILGIASPSKVFMEIGHHVTSGLVLGITGGQQQAAQASAGLARAVISGAGRPSLGLGVGGTGAGGVTVINNITVQGSVIRERELYDIVQTQALRYGRRNPTSGLALTNR